MIPKTWPLLKFDFRFVDNDGLNGATISQEDNRLIAKLRRSYLIPPSLPSDPLNLTDPEEFDTSMGQAQVVRRLLRYKVSVLKEFEGNSGIN